MLWVLAEIIISFGIESNVCAFRPDTKMTMISR